MLLWKSRVKPRNTLPRKENWTGIRGVLSPRVVILSRYRRWEDKECFSVETPWKSRNTLPRKENCSEPVFLNVYGMNTASLCGLAGRYDNPFPTRFLAPIDCLKIPAQESMEFCLPELWFYADRRWEDKECFSLETPSKSRNTLPRKENCSEPVFINVYGMNSANLCSLAGRYDNPIPTRFLV